MVRVCLLLLATVPVQAADDLKLALEAFQAGKSEPKRYAEASALFATAVKAVPLTTEQSAAWAYCRVRIAAERWNAARGDTVVGKQVAAEVCAALALAPEYAELQKFGREVIRATGQTPPAAPVKATGWFSIETANFRVRYPAAVAEQATAIAKAAEEQRTAIFTRWSGPPGAGWGVKCEIVLHANASDFKDATGLAATATGHALVQMEDNRPTLRRIDLRADDETLAIDALPRELTQIVLGDLFPTSAPPRWASEGMAVLAMSPTAVERFLKTAVSQATRNELPTATALLEGKSENTVAAAALADFLARQKGERSLTVFLRDSQRYGLEKSVERQFGFANLAALDTAWRADMKR